MDNTKNLVTIFGGSGFVGTQIVQLLARAGLPDSRGGAPARSRRARQAAGRGRAR